jgi:hypothetical protein
MRLKRSKRLWAKWKKLLWLKWKKEPIETPVEEETEELPESNVKLKETEEE